VEAIRDNIREFSIPAAERIRILRLIPTLPDSMSGADTLCQQVINALPKEKRGLSSSGGAKATRSSSGGTGWRR